MDQDHIIALCLIGALIMAIVAALMPRDIVIEFESDEDDDMDGMA